MANHLWHQYLEEVKNNENLVVCFAATKTATVEVVVNHYPGTYYNSCFHRCNQNTGKELHETGSYARKFSRHQLITALL